MKMRWVVAVMVLVAGLVSGCGPGKGPGRVVRLVETGADTTDLYSIPFGWSGFARDGQVAWLWPGAILGGDPGVISYRREDGESLRLGIGGNGITRLDGKVIGVESKDDSAVAWLEQASPAELSDIRVLAPPGKLSHAMLQRLAVANPGVGLLLEDRETVAEILSLFRPRWLSLGEDLDSIAGLLASQRDIETLWTSATDSASLGAIRELPNLRGLVLSEWEPPYGRLPERLDALWLAESQVDAQALSDLHNVRTLSLSGSWWSGPFDFARFQRLRWFGFPKNTSQAEFAAMVQAHPALEVIELLEMNDSIDLAPLGELRHLRAVTLDGDFTNLNVLKSIPTLEFVGFSDDMWREVSEEASVIQAALPAAAVVKVTSLCLGSGWILLILPIVLLVVLAAPRRRAA